MKRKQSDNEIISRSMAIINNGTTTELIANALAGFGYDRNRMAEGAQLLAEAESLSNEQRREKGQAAGARQRWELAWEELDRSYRRIRKLAKVRFENNPELLQNLALKGKVPQVYVPFLAMVESFLSALDQPLIDQLSVYQITQSTIDELTALVTRTKQLRTEYVQKKSHAEAVTAQKRAAIVALSRWCAGYLKIARIALADMPQMLEALGVVVKA